MGKRQNQNDQQQQQQKQQEQSSTPNQVGRGDAMPLQNDQAPVPPGTPTEPADENGNVKRRSGMIAKKDFHITHNDFDRAIKAGDDLSDIPAEYHANLRTEGVIE